MSTTYLLYTEAKVNGLWRCIDGYIPYKGYGEKREKLSLMTMYKSGSRSYFGETYDELVSIGRSVLFTDLSVEIQNEHPRLKYQESFWGDEKSDKEVAYYTVVSKQDFVSKVPKGYQYHGVYHKDHIAALESGEIEYLYDYDEEDKVDMKSLTEEERKCYQYYEWDDPMGWHRFFKHIEGILELTIEKYFSNTFNEPDDVRIVVLRL